MFSLTHFLSTSCCGTTLDTTMKSTSVVSRQCVIVRQFRTLSVVGLRAWNQLHVSLHQMDFVETFKRNLKAKFFTDAFHESEQLTSSQTNFFYLNVILFYIVLSRWALLCSFVSDAIEIHIATVIRVVSSEISGGKFPKIYSNLSGNLLITYVNQLLPSPTLQSDAVK